MAQSANTIPMTPVQSSQIKAIGWANGTLAIEFNHNPKRIVYHYPNFSAADWAAFQGAESKGSFFYKAVKPRYPEGFLRVPLESAATAA